jgi:hypothetical protein
MEFDRKNAIIGFLKENLYRSYDKVRFKINF